MIVWWLETFEQLLYYFPIYRHILGIFCQSLYLWISRVFPVVSIRLFVSFLLLCILAIYTSVYLSNILLKSTSTTAQRMYLLNWRRNRRFVLPLKKFSSLLNARMQLQEYHESESQTLSTLTFIAFYFLEKLMKSKNIEQE